MRNDIVVRGFLPEILRLKTGETGNSEIPKAQTKNKNKKQNICSLNSTDQ